MMRFISVLREKPWLQDSQQGYKQGSDQFVVGTEHELTGFDSARIALRFFLGLISIIFSLFIITFLERSQYPDFQALAGSAWLPLTEPVALWINTAVLAGACGALHLSVSSAQRHVVQASANYMLAGILLSSLFMCGQVWVWLMLMEQGYYLASNPANSYYYLFTGIHGIHLFGGMLVLLKNGLKFWYGAPIQVIGDSLRLCATYWHYLLAVWLVLFGLLASSPETYQAIAAFCGFLR